MCKALHVWGFVYGSFGGVFCVKEERKVAVTSIQIHEVFSMFLLKVEVEELVPRPSSWAAFMSKSVS